MRTCSPNTDSLLANIKNEAAVDVLIAGIDSSEQSIRHQSLRAIMVRLEPKGHMEVFRRMQTFDEDSKAIITENSQRLVALVGEVLFDPAPQNAAFARQATISFRLYGTLPNLIEALNKEDDPTVAKETAATILELTDLFYNQLSGNDDQASRKNEEALRNRLTSCLEDAVRGYKSHNQPDVVEAFLTIAKSKNVGLNNLMQRPDESCYPVMVRLLSESSRGGIIRLLLGFVDNLKPPRMASKVISKRSDLKFVSNLLHAIGPRPLRTVCSSIAQIDSIVWAVPEHELFAQLDDEAQEGAVSMILASSMDRQNALRVIEYILVAGKTGGRRAAALALQRFEEPEVAPIVIRAINDKDEYVRAHLIKQLRPRGIPGAMSLILRLIDNNSTVIHQAVKEAMPEFTLKQFITHLDSMDEDLRTVAGHMVRRIDVDAPDNLASEMGCRSPVQRRRAVNAASVMGMVPELQDKVIKLLSDDDHMVRVAAASALSECKSMPTWDALRDALLDKSFVVQEAAELSLQRICESLSKEVEEDETEEILEEANK